MSSLFTKINSVAQNELNIIRKKTWTLETCGAKIFQNNTLQKYKMLSSNVSYSVFKHFEGSSLHTPGILGGKLYSDSLINMINRWDWNRNFLKAFQNKDRTVACVDYFLWGLSYLVLETGHCLQFKLLSQSFWPHCF